jgi:hypothetical protein
METLISESSSVDRSGAAQGKSLLPSLLKTSTTLKDMFYYVVSMMDSVLFDLSLMSSLLCV